jgi:hypothetical protein
VFTNFTIGADDGCLRQGLDYIQPKSGSQGV